MEKIDEILENMEFLDNWEDKYKYIIELGQGLDILPDDLKNAQTKVNGCVSQVWLHSTVTDSTTNEKYIKFVDGDDILVPNATSNLIQPFLLSLSTLL